MFNAANGASQQQQNRVCPSGLEKTSNKKLIKPVLMQVEVFLMFYLKRRKRTKHRWESTGD